MVDGSGCDLYRALVRDATRGNHSLEADAGMLIVHTLCQKAERIVQSRMPAANDFCCVSPRSGIFCFEQTTEQLGFRRIEQFIDSERFEQVAFVKLLARIKIPHPPFNGLAHFVRISFGPKALRTQPARS